MAGSCAQIIPTHEHESGSPHKLRRQTEVTTLLNPLANQDDQTPDQFPKLSSLSAAFFYQFVPVPTDSQPPPEYVAIPCKGKPDLYGEVAAWNMIWEAGTLRYEMLDDHRWFKGLEWLKPFQTRGVDVRLIPLKGSCRYNIYAPLYHLLPLGTLKKFGLPPLKQGHWPGGPDWSETTAALPKDFQTRIENAFAHHVWRHLCPGSPLSGFSKQEPLVTLTHGLDFWLPYIDIVIQKRLKQLGRVKIENGKQSALLRKLRAKCPPNIIPSRPLFGGLAWMGESEALEATREMVEVADQYGRLRSIIDAIKSNRSCPQELPNIYETMEVALILAMPFLFEAGVLPERPIVRGVLLFVRRH